MSVSHTICQYVHVPSLSVSLLSVPLFPEEWKNTSSPEKDKKAKRKSIGRMFAKKKAE